MHNRIEIDTNKIDKIYYFLKNETGRYYLMESKWTKVVNDYFISGRSENEIRSFNQWGKNRYLRCVINRLPKSIDYVMKYEVCE